MLNVNQLPNAARIWGHILRGWNKKNQHKWRQGVKQMSHMLAFDVFQKHARLNILIY